MPEPVKNLSELSDEKLAELVKQKMTVHLMCLPSDICEILAF